MILENAINSHSFKYFSVGTYDYKKPGCGA
jgi:hypothetical protein